MLTVPLATLLYLPHVEASDASMVGAVMHMSVDGTFEPDAPSECVSAYRVPPVVPIAIPLPPSPLSRHSEPGPSGPVPFSASIASSAWPCLHPPLSFLPMHAPAPPGIPTPGQRHGGSSYLRWMHLGRGGAPCISCTRSSPSHSCFR